MSSVKKIVLNLNSNPQEIINDLAIQTEREEPTSFKIFPNTSPYTFKYFCKQRKKNLFPQSEPAIGKEPNIESNFKPVSKDANYFTKNIPYIKNKDIKLFRRYEYDNYKYKVDRTKLYDMKKLKPIQSKNSTLYKTTLFRGNKFIIDAMRKNYEEKKSPVSLLEDFYDKIEEEHSPTYQKPSVNNLMQKSKPYVASDSLYKELTLKKNELLSQLSNNNDIIYQNKNKINKDELIGYDGKLIKSKIDNIPITFPTSYIHNKKYISISERERYEKINDTFLKLKHLSSLDNNDKFLSQYIRDFSKKYGFTILSNEQVINFTKFLQKEPFPIDVNKSMKDNVSLALSYSENNLKNLKNYNKNNNNLYNEHTIRSSSTAKSIEVNKSKMKTLLDDMEKQSKLYRDKSTKDTETLYKELTNELDTIIHEREKTKNIKIPLPQHKNNNSYNSLYITQKDLSNNIGKNIDLRLGRREYENENLNKTNPMKKMKLIEMNKRLYYNRVEKQNGFDLSQIEKNKKMTEYIVRERTKRKLIMNKIKEEYENDLK